MKFKDNIWLSFFLLSLNEGRQHDNQELPLMLTTNIPIIFFRAHREYWIPWTGTHMFGSHMQS